MAGIYIHIPFCKSRCIYCDFYSGTNEEQIDAFVQSICMEIRARKSEITESVKTIYWGGGTPSRLSRDHFEQIFQTLFNLFPIEFDAEITFETNPDDLTPQYIEMLSMLPFNRISMGIQSFHDEELIFLSRRHSAQQAIEAVKQCQRIGFNNISIDLIYGLPNQTMDIWKKNLQQACELNVQHISAYHLIYEEKTKLYTMLQAGKVTPANEQLSTEMFSELIDTLTGNDFVHYEISNFGKLGFFSCHNSSYWKGEKYVGLGPAAHSFDGNTRFWNVASLTQYIESINRGERLYESEHLNLNERYNEFILTGLRTMWGVDLSELKKRFGSNFFDYCLKNAQKYRDNHLLEIKNDSMQLTREGLFISDGIISELLWVE